MALQMMVQNIIILLFELSDRWAFTKNLELRPELHLNLNIADSSWNINVNCSKNDAEKRAVARDISLTDEELHEGCLLMRKVLDRNGTILVYGASEDLPRWKTKLVARGFQVQHSTITVVFAPSASVYNRKPNAVYNCTHFILRAWRFNKTPISNLMGNEFQIGHIASNYSVRSNVINNYIPVRRQYRRRGLDGKKVRVEEKSPEIFMELIERFSEKGVLVADFFSGLGSSGEAAMRVNRKCID